MASQPGRDGPSSPHPAWAPGHVESEDQLFLTKVGEAAAPRQRQLSLGCSSRAQTSNAGDSWASEAVLANSEVLSLSPLELMSNKDFLLGAPE